jgi:hypothetical protein
MRQREFIAGLGVAAWPLVASAQGRLPSKVGNWEFKTHKTRFDHMCVRFALKSGE